MKRHFVDGYGYIEFCNGSEGRGWYGYVTPDGQPGASFAGKFLGSNADEVVIVHPELAERFEKAGVAAFR